MEKIVKGYKVTLPDYTSLHGTDKLVWKSGVTYIYSGNIEMCRKGFHFCKNAADCFCYYDFNSENHVFEVEALGDVDLRDNKCVTNELLIGRELDWHEVLEIVNSGKYNTGFLNSGSQNSGGWNSGDFNSGDRNSGGWNSGSRNSGDWNSGDRNSGARNIGGWNSGDFNSGDRNSGEWNSSNWNSGDRNSGDRNSGDWNSGSQNSGSNNSGDWNSGDRNSGDLNSGDWNGGDRNSGGWNRGDWNSGDFNRGHRNSGDRNSGDRNSGGWNSGGWNSGGWNSGNRNSGNWNSGDLNSGFLNSDTPSMRMFNKDTGLTYQEARNLKGIQAMSYHFENNFWVYSENMSDSEKEEHPEHEVTGGYLRILPYKEACALMWRNMDKTERQAVKDLPNFNPEIYEAITGIRV